MALFSGRRIKFEDVRSTALRFKCTEIGGDNSESLLCFRTPDGHDVNVFYDLGLVSITLQHPRQGPLSVFRWQVSLSQLSDIFSNPRKQMPHDYYAEGPKTLPMESASEMISRSYLSLVRERSAIRAEMAALVGRADEIGIRINGAVVDDTHKGYGASDTESSMDEFGRRAVDVEVTRLLQEQSQMNTQIKTLLEKQRPPPPTSSSQSLSKPTKLTTAKDQGLSSGPSNSRHSKRPPMPTGGRPRHNSTDSSDDDTVRPASGVNSKIPFEAQKSIINPGVSLSAVNSPFRQRGNQCCYALTRQEYHKEFGNAWSVKPPNIVSLGRGYVIIYDDGSVTWWDVPDLLDKKLKDQTAAAQSVRYISLGADENYYVKFMDGKMEWCGPDTFGEALKTGVQKKRLLVDKVAFGTNQAWLILWSDGSVESSRLPLSLDAVVGDEKSVSEKPIKDISMGPNEEWFVIHKDNSVRADNLPDALYKILAEIQEASGRVRQVIFGENSSWYVRYWDGSS